MFHFAWTTVPKVWKTDKPFKKTFGTFLVLIRLDIIENNPQISQMEIFKGKICENRRNLRIKMALTAITDKVYYIQKWSQKVIK